MKFMGTALWIAATCLGLLALVYLWQDRLLYFLQRATVEEVVGAGLTPWPSAQDFRGLVAEGAAVLADRPGVPAWMSRVNASTAS